MPKFQARYFNDLDEAIPCRVDPVEASDHRSATKLARAEMKTGEVRVEIADLDDEFRRGTPDVDAAPFVAEATQAVTEKLGQAAEMIHERYDDIRDKTLTAADDLDRIIRGKPYLAVAVAVGVGLLVGLHWGAGDRRVVYLKDAR